MFGFCLPPNREMGGKHYEKKVLLCMGLLRLRKLKQYFSEVLRGPILLMRKGEQETRSIAGLASQTRVSYF